MSRIGQAEAAFAGGVSMAPSRAARLALCGVSVLLVSSLAAALDVEVKRLDGRVFRGKLAELTPRIVVETPEGSASFEFADILWLRPLNAGGPVGELPAAGPLRFLLADGSSFTGRIQDAGERDFGVRFGPDRTARLEASMLRAIFSTDAAGDALGEVLRAVRERATASRSRFAAAPVKDVVVLRRKQGPLVLEGALRRIEVTRVRFVWNERDLPMKWSQLAGVVFGRPSPRRPSCRVFLRGDEVFAGRIVGGSPESLVLRSAILGELTLPWSRVERIESHSDRLVFLSDLAPSGYEFEPFFEKRWEFTVDASLTGRPLRLGGRVYAKGVALHSRATIVYDIAGAFQQFAASAGILDEMGTRGNVAMRVLGDGKLLWEGEDIRGGQSPREVVVSIAGVERLTLQVDFGEDLDLSDHACWADARLIR